MISKDSVRVFPFAGDGRWYWQDAECDEPMGPFDSYRDAWRDYKAMRKQPRFGVCAHGVPFADTDGSYAEACEDCREEHSHGIEEQAIERGGYR